MTNYDRFLFTYTAELWKEIKIARSDNPSFYTWAKSSDDVLNYCSQICEKIRYGKPRAALAVTKSTAGRRTCRIIGIEAVSAKIRQYILEDLIDGQAK